MVTFLTIPIESAPHDFGVERDGCYVHQTIWKKWIDAQTTETLFVEVKETTPSEQKHILYVAGYHRDEEEILYVPKRCCGDGTVKVRMLHTEPPKATKLVLQPLDPELYDCPLQEALSQELSNWHCLQKHTTITFACEQLGGLLVDVFVKDMEPDSDVVLLRGEVPLDLAEQIVGPQTQQQHQPSASSVAVQVPSFNPVATEDNFFDSVLPTQPQETKKGFIPFGGTGHRC
jgi:hypothetical protein